MDSKRCGDDLRQSFAVWPPPVSVQALFASGPVRPPLNRWGKHEDGSSFYDSQFQTERILAQLKLTHLCGLFIIINYNHLLLLLNNERFTFGHI